MNGLGGTAGGGGGSYQSEDDFDDYNTKPPVYYNSTSTSSNVNSGGSGINTTTSSSSLGGHQSTLTSGGYGSTSQSSRGQICCLVDDGRRCHRPAGNASYSKRIQKTVYYKRLRLETDTHAQHIYICDYHKMVIQNARTSKQTKRDEDEDDMVEGDDIPEVDLFQLQVNTLRRYKKHFKIPTRPGLNKAQLADVLMRHFKTIPVSEKEIVTYFIYMVKSERNKLDTTSRQENTAESMERY